MRKYLLTLKFEESGSEGLLTSSQRLPGFCAGGRRTRGQCRSASATAIDIISDCPKLMPDK
jgi:hypothetical protein